MKRRMFDEWFADFVHYNENGNVKQTYVTPEGHKLGNWVNRIRMGEHRLTEEQKKRLTEAGFVWKVYRTFEEWLTDFVRYNENGNVKQTYVTPEGHKLGNWVQCIRNGEYRVTEEQKKRLNEVGFKWKAKVGRTFEDWLVDFIRYNHNGNVAANYVTPEGNKLGQWVHNIRIGNYKLTDEQRKRLNDAGFMWRFKRVRRT